MTFFSFFFFYNMKKLVPTEFLRLVKVGKMNFTKRLLPFLISSKTTQKLNLHDKVS